MAITEENRHQLYVRLEEVLGHAEATVMMEHLPPVGWADVATKQDVAALQAATKHDIDALRVATKQDIQASEQRITDRFEARLQTELREQTSRFLLATGAMLTLLLTLQQVVAASLS